MLAGVGGACCRGSADGASAHVQDFREPPSRSGRPGPGRNFSFLLLGGSQSAHLADSRGGSGELSCPAHRRTHRPGCLVLLSLRRRLQVGGSCRSPAGPSVWGRRCGKPAVPPACITESESQSLSVTNPCRQRWCLSFSSFFFLFYKLIWI